MIEEKYSDISSELASRIADGVYTERFPKASSIAREFDVNVKTAQKAVRVLSKRGLVITKRGRGSVVVHPTRPSVPSACHAYLLPLSADVDSPANPWRATAMCLVDAFWQAASRRKVELTMLPGAPVPGQLPGDAVVLSLPWQTPEKIASLVSHDYQLLAMNFMRDAYPETCDLPFVAIAHNARLEVRDAIAHLQVRGRHKIAVIEQAGRSQPMMPMVIQELQDRGLPVLDRAMIKDAGELAIRELLARKVQFDALVIRNHRDAATAIRVLEAEGVQIPKDVAVITLAADAADVLQGHHEITYLASNFEAMARQAMDIITAQDFTPRTILVPKLLVIGTTT